MTADKPIPTVADPQAVETPPAREPVKPGSPQDTSSLAAAWRRGMTPPPLAPGEPEPPPGFD